MLLITPASTGWKSAIFRASIRRLADDGLPRDQIVPHGLPRVQKQGVPASVDVASLSADAPPTIDATLTAGGST